MLLFDNPLRGKKNRTNQLFSDLCQEMNWLVPN
jgi:hypothetical protein